MSHRNVRVTNLDVALRPVAGAADNVLAVSTGAVKAAALADATRHVLYGVEGDVRVKFDGTAPTASVGIWIRDGSTGTMSREMFAAAQWISKTGSAASLSYAQLG
jgi:hypothetical protein